MKKYLTILLLLETFNLQAQSYSSITYDCNKNKLSNYKEIFHNNSFNFVLTNINTFKYKVKINSNPTTYNSVPPDLINKYLLAQAPDSRTIPAPSKPDTSMKVMGYYINASPNLDSLKKDYLELSKSVDFYNLLKDLVISIHAPSDIIIIKKSYYKNYTHNTIKENKKDNIMVNEDATEVFNIYTYYSDLKNNIINNAKVILNDTAISTNDKQEIDSIVINTKKIESDSVYRKLANFYGEINKERFTVCLLIPRPDADEITINIIAKIDPKLKITGDSIKISIPLLVRGGIKIDFSPGIFCSNIVDKEYVNKPSYRNSTDSISGYNLVRNAKVQYSYGFAGYMHVYWRNAGYCNGGLSLGVGLDQNAQVKIMPGFNLIIGRKQRFILNGGLAFGKMKDLSPIQSESHLYKTITNPIYSESYSFGWFGGISYNLTK